MKPSTYIKDYMLKKKKGIEFYFRAWTSVTETVLLQIIIVIKSSRDV